MLHLAHAGLSNLDLEGKTLLEIGPGDSIATVIIAYAYGAKAILVDFESYAKNTPETYRALCNLLNSRDLRVPDLSQLHSIDESFVTCDGRYITEGNNKLAQDRRGIGRFGLFTGRS